MADLIYNVAKKALCDGTIDYLTDTIKIALVTSSYTPDKDAHEDFADVTNEITGTGYTAGGATVGTKTITVDNANDRAVFDAANPTWSTATFTARGAVVYLSTGTAGTSTLICYIDFGSDKSPSGTDFEIILPATGFFYLG